MRWQAQPPTRPGALDVLIPPRRRGRRRRARRPSSPGAGPVSSGRAGTGAAIGPSSASTAARSGGGPTGRLCAPPCTIARTCAAPVAPQQRRDPRPGVPPGEAGIVGHDIGRPVVVQGDRHASAEFRNSPLATIAGTGSPADARPPAAARPITVSSSWGGPMPHLAPMRAARPAGRAGPPRRRRGGGPNPHDLGRRHAHLVRPWCRS